MIRDGAGLEIRCAVDALETAGWTVTHDADADGWTATVTGAGCRIDLVVRPRTWLGLDITVTSDTDLSMIRHAIDTDLYRLDDERNWDFSAEIEREIVGFLDALRAGAVRVWIKGRAAAMVWPIDGGFYRLRRWWWIASGRAYASRSEAERDGRFRPLTP